MALPLSQQIALDMLCPPVVTALWWLKSKNLANIVQNNSPTERTKVWTNRGAWILLALLYCLMFGITLYAHLVTPRAQ